MKLVVTEGIRDTQKGVPAVLFALPYEKNRSNRYEVAIPKPASLHLTHHLNSAIKGLNDFKGKLLPVLPASPRAHGVILGTLYLPVAMMLMGLVMRGVAFDFRIKVAAGHKPLWKQAQCWPAAAKAMCWAHASLAFMAPAGPPFSMR